MREASGWFKPGDKCKFDGKTTTWSTSNDDYVMLFDTHPIGYIEYFAPIGKQANGEHHEADFSTPPRAVKADARNILVRGAR